MGLTVTFVSGPRCSGKSTLVRRMIDRLWKTEPHYIRLARSGSGERPQSAPAEALSECGVASAGRLEYDAEHIFEILPDALTAIHRRDRYGSVIIEADADPTLRHAYPYDHRIFMMPMPPAIEEVFREPAQAAEELQRVLDDTVAFASEIFGLFSQQEQDEVEPAEDRPSLTSTQARGFLYSPLGDELATRIQLQQTYHGLVESDIVVVNPGFGAKGPETAACLGRIERLLGRIRGIHKRGGELFLCDPSDPNGKVCKKLLKALKPMCQGGK